ncbi:MAG: SPFH domain-containing protein [Phycisphaerales bacterium]
MMIAFFFVSILIALVVVVAAFKSPNTKLRGVAALGALVIIAIGFLLSSFVMVGPRETGIVTKNFFGGRLKDGRIIATDGEIGVQADILAPGVYFGYVPFVYDVKTVPITDVPAQQVALLEAVDGLPLEDGEVFAPEWPKESIQKMLDAKHFLTDGKGHRGRQITVLTPGAYRVNTYLFKVKLVDQTEVVPGEVAVLTANFGTRPSGSTVPGHEEIRIASKGEMGVQSEPMPPGRYALNTEAFKVTEIWTTPMVAHFTAAQSGTYQSNESGQPVLRGNRNVDQGQAAVDAAREEREITVRTSDGFTFPVDVRIEYRVLPSEASLLVATLKDDEGVQFRNALNSAVRAIFRNNAEKVKALDYVNSRSQQESQSLGALKQEMEHFGVTITAVRIGNVGDEASLGTLLKTQTEREIARQEQITYAEQQKTAEQKKLLSKAQQEAEEEKRLATAAYGAKIADEDRKKKEIEAEAEAAAIKIKATAQAEAYKEIAEQIGKSNAAMIEVLKIVGEKGIQITPRVFIGGGSAGGAGGSAFNGDSGNTALIGTMLDSLISREEDKPAPRSTPEASPRPGSASNR